MKSIDGFDILSEEFATVDMEKRAAWTMREGWATHRNAARQVQVIDDALSSFHGRLAFLKEQLPAAEGGAKKAVERSIKDFEHKTKMLTSQRQNIVGGASRTLEGLSTKGVGPLEKAKAYFGLGGRPHLTSKMTELTSMGTRVADVEIPTKPSKALETAGRMLKKHWRIPAMGAAGVGAGIGLRALLRKKKESNTIPSV